MRILIAGDYCPQKRVLNIFQKNDYHLVFGQIKDLIASFDYAIVNLECPITKGGERALDKCGPHLHSDENGIRALQWAGFNCVTLANNHFLDYGKEGVINTLDICKKYMIDTVGGGLNLKEASAVLYKTLAGKKLAIINCCEHEFSIASEDMPGSNPINPVRQYYAIQDAKQNADYVLIIVHGGNEYYQLPSPRMQETYRFFVDAGADAVINHHQHIYSGFEVYKGKPIIYGLGNFCFDDDSRKNTPWNNGYFVELLFENQVVSMQVIPYLQCGLEPRVRFLENVEVDRFYKNISELNKDILDSSILENKYNAFLSSSNPGFLFEPYSNRVLLGLYRRHLLPSFQNKKKKREILAYLQCESHIVKLINYLKQ